MQVPVQVHQPLLRPHHRGAQDAFTGGDGKNSDEESEEQKQIQTESDSPPPTLAGLASCVGCFALWWRHHNEAVAGVVFGFLCAFALTGIIFPFSFTFSFPLSTPRPIRAPPSSRSPPGYWSNVNHEWQPGMQVRVEQRRQWLDQQVPLARMQALRAEPSSTLKSPPPLSPLSLFFANYTRFHALSLSSLSPTTRFLIHRSDEYSLQGMGNRLLSLISGFLLAALTDRVFILDWSHSEDQFTLDDLFAPPPIDWTYSSIEQFYGVDAIRSGMAREQLTVTETWANSTATYEELLCQSGDLWRGSDVQFLWLSSNQFFAPLLYHNPHFRSQLETWGFTAGQLSIFVFQYILHPSPTIQLELDRFTSTHWKPYMIGVQLRQKDGHATSEEITTLAFQCAAVLVESLPQRLRERGDIGWYLATDAEEEAMQTVQDIAANLSRLHSSAPPISLSILPCPPRPWFGSEQRSHVLCSVLHLFLLTLTDDLVMSRASTFGDVAHAISALSPMVLTEAGTCMRQAWLDPCFHHWQYVKRLSCWNKWTMVNVEDVNGFCVGSSKPKDSALGQ